MKNNKYAPYILAPVLLLVWGTIFYKIYVGMAGEEVDLVDTPTLFASAITTKTDENYVLLLDYPDPFLNKSISKDVGDTRSSYASGNYSPDQNLVPQNTRISNNRNTNNSNKTPTKTPTVANIQPVATDPNMPKILYQGFQVVERDTVAILKINNRFFPNVRKGDVFEGIIIEKIFNDSIRILNNRNRMLVRRSI